MASFLTQKANPKSHERFSRPALQDIPSTSAHGLIRSAGECPAEQGDEGDWFGPELAPADLFPVLVKILISGYIWLGIACLLAFFVAYMLVLTWADYSYVQPASAFSYAVVAVLSYFLLEEVVPPLRWAGIAVICVGVFVVGHTPQSTTEKA